MSKFFEKFEFSFSQIRQQDSFFCAAFCGICGLMPLFCSYFFVLSKVKHAAPLLHSSLFELFGHGSPLFDTFRHYPSQSPFLCQHFSAFFDKLRHQTTPHIPCKTILLRRFSESGQCHLVPFHRAFTATRWKLHPSRASHPHKSTSLMRSMLSLRCASLRGDCCLFMV